MVDFADNSRYPIPLLGQGAERICLKFSDKPDKSLTHRALIFSSMAKGESRIWNPLLGEDCLTTAQVVRTLGCEVDIPSNPGQPLVVRSPGIHHWHTQPLPLDFGNSGTTARLMTGVLASRPGMVATVSGDASLSQRPMKRVVEPLRRLGASIDYLKEPGFLPMKISGKQLQPGSIQADKASAQIKSALMLAGMSVEGVVTITLPAGGRDHTELLLQRLGAKITVESQAAHHEKITLRGPFMPQSGDWRVPNDPSSAAFLCVLPLIHGRGEVKCSELLLNPGRTFFLSVLERMGAEIVVENRRMVDLEGINYIEEVGDVTIRLRSALKGTDITPQEAPMVIDEIPILSVAASFASTPSTFRGLTELRVKESDRFAQTASLLTHAQVDVTAINDELHIKPRSGPLNPFAFDAKGDHRLAMAGAIMMTRASRPGSEIVGGRCVDVSFPGFFRLLDGMVN